MLSNRGLGIKAKKGLHDGVIISTALYGAEARGTRCTERRKVNVLEKFGWSVTNGPSWNKKELASRAGQSIEIVWACGKNG